MNDEQYTKVQGQIDVYKDPEDPTKRADGPQTLNYLWYQIDNLEVRLDCSNKNLNNIIAYNEKLKLKVNQLRIEKKNLIDTFKKLSNKVKDTTIFDNLTTSTGAIIGADGKYGEYPGY